ncbi:MAG: MFS transporter [Candidatus Dormiibacterota bacterium]
MTSKSPGLVANIRALPRAVWILCIGTFINRFGGFVAVFLVLFLTRDGYSPALAGLAVAAFGLGSIGGSALGGYLADRIGRSETIVLSMLTTAAATIALLLVRGLPAVLLMSGVVGLTQQVVRAPTTALMADLVPPQGRVAAMGVMRFFINAGFALGPAAAGFLADRSFPLLFGLDAATSVIFAVIALLLLPRGAPRLERREVRAEGTRTILADRGFLLFLAATLAASMVYLQATTTFPLWVTRSGYSNAVYGYLVGLNGGIIMLLELLLISVTQRLPARPVIAGGFLLVGVGFALTLGAHTLPLLAITVLVWTLGEMTAFPMSTAYVADVAPVHLRGRYQGAWGLMWSLGLMLGPGLGGWLFDANPNLLWILCGVAGAIAAVLVLLGPNARVSAPNAALTTEAPATSPPA